MLNERVWALLFLVCCPAVPAAARAADDGTSAGISVVVVHGQHAEQGGTASAPLIPAPLLNIAHRFRNVEIDAEGIPPLRSFPVGNNGLGMQNIALSYLSGSVRYWNRRGTFALGIGETLYNQRTDYLGFSSPNFTEWQYDKSRVAGALYEAVNRLPLHGGSVLETWIAYNPVLHGRMSWTNYETFNGGTRTQDLLPDWERGSQIQAEVRLERPAGPYTISYGMRYLNYQAYFDGGFFADRNTFLMPFVGVTRRLGR